MTLNLILKNIKTISVMINKMCWVDSGTGYNEQTGHWWVTYEEGMGCIN